jgi:hypothetical protein
MTEKQNYLFISVILFISLFPICMHLAIDTDHPLIIDSLYVQKAENNAIEWCYTVLDKYSCQRINSIMNNIDYNHIDVYCGIFCGSDIHSARECKTLWHRKYELAQYYYTVNYSLSIFIFGLVLFCIFKYNTGKIHTSEHTYHIIPDTPSDTPSDIETLP